MPLKDIFNLNSVKQNIYWQPTVCTSLRLEENHLSLRGGGCDDQNVNHLWYETVQKEETDPSFCGTCTQVNAKQASLLKHPPSLSFLPYKSCDRSLNSSYGLYFSCPLAPKWEILPSFWSFPASCLWLEPPSVDVLRLGCFPDSRLLYLLVQGLLAHRVHQASLPSAKMVAVHAASACFEAIALFSPTAGPGWALFSPRSDLLLSSHDNPVLPFILILIHWRRPVDSSCLHFLRSTVGSCLQITPEGFCWGSVLLDNLMWSTVSVFDLWPLDILPHIWLYNSSVWVYGSCYFQKAGNFETRICLLLLFFNWILCWWINVGALELFAKILEICPQNCSRYTTLYLLHILTLRFRVC